MHMVSWVDSVEWPRALILATRRCSSARMPMNWSQSVQPCRRRKRCIVLIFRALVQPRATGFGRYCRLRISASKGSPLRLAVSKSTTAKPGSVGRYSSQWMGTCQCLAQPRTKRSVASTSLPVLAKQTTVSAGKPPLACSTRQSMYALVRPPLKLMQVGDSIRNGSRIRAVSSRWPRRMPVGGPDRGWRQARARGCGRGTKEEASVRRLEGLAVSGRTVPAAPPATTGV